MNPSPNPPRALHPRPEPADDCRCLCGSLLARVVGGSVELKCRRCKRTHRIPLDSSTDLSSLRACGELE